MRCIEIAQTMRKNVEWFRININMRCIEIFLKGAVYDNGRID